MLLCDFDAAVQVGDVREGDVLGRFVGEKTRHVFGHGSHGTCEVKQPGAVVGVSVSFFFKGGTTKTTGGKVVWDFATGWTFCKISTHR